MRTLYCRSGTRRLLPALAVALLGSSSALPGGAWASEGSADASARLPEGAVLADLPMLAVTGSPRVHFDLAAVGDPPLPVVLDTGFGPSVAGTSGLRSFGGKPVPGDQKTFQRNTVLGRPLSVVLTNRKAEQAHAYPFVRLGGKFLRDFVVELDFTARRVRFLDPAKIELPETTSGPEVAVFDLLVGNSRPFIDVDVNGHPVRLALDTSATVPIWLRTRDLVKSAVSPKTLPVLRGRGKRQSTLRVFETDLVRLGSLDLGVFPVIVSQDSQSDEFGGNGHVLGIDVLSQFRVRLDIARSRLWLRRERSQPVRFAGLPYSRTRNSGAYVALLGSGFEVFGVLPDSPAEAIGLQPGDRIDQGAGFTTLRELLGTIQQQAPLLIQRPAAAPGTFTEVLLPEPIQTPPSESEPDRDG